MTVSKHDLQNYDLNLTNDYENEKPIIPKTGDGLVFRVAQTMMIMSSVLLVALIYAYKKFLNM